MKEYEIEIEFVFKGKVVVKANKPTEAIEKADKGLSMNAGNILSSLYSDLVSSEVRKYADKVFKSIKEVEK